MPSLSQFSVTDDLPWVRHGESACPIDTTLRLIGGKWKPRVAHRLRTGPLRYSEIQRDLPGISSQVLANVLREMERDRLVAHDEARYRLTPLGESLRPVMDAMCAWGEAHRAGTLPG